MFRALFLSIIFVFTLTVFTSTIVPTLKEIRPAVEKILRSGAF